MLFEQYRDTKMTIHARLMVGVAAALVSFSGPAISQTTSEDLQAKFQAQSADAQRRDPAMSGDCPPDRDPSLGECRGLGIVPGTGGTAAPAAADASGDVAQVTYTNLDPDKQINIQIQFDFDSASIRADQTTVLDVMCDAMKAVDIPLFQIIGHTDAAGSADYNQSLSLLRAEEVRRHLIANCGIAAERLQAVGMGEAVPLNAADPRADENRRVEFQALG